MTDEATVDRVARAIMLARAPDATDNELWNYISAARAALAAMPIEGWQLVPIEPTEAMMEAWYDSAYEARNDVDGKPFPYGIAPIEWFPPAYRAMLAATPPSAPPVAAEQS